MTKGKVSKPRVRNDYKAKYACRICKVSDNKSSRLSSRVFKSVISSSIRDLIQSNTTSDKIREKLLRRYPAHKKKLTHDMVRSHIKLESGVTVHHDTMKASGQEIENEQSVFIDDMKLTMTTKAGQVDIHVMCAVSWSGLRRLSLCFDEKHCTQHFTRSILKKYDKKSLPFQVLMKSSVEDISEVKRLFTRLSLHTLLFYPVECTVTSPARKYIQMILELTPEPDSSKEVEAAFKQAETEISKGQCQKWIERFINTTKTQLNPM